MRNLSSSSDEMAMISAADDDRWTAVFGYLNEGANVNVKSDDLDGNRLIHIAARHGDPEIIEKLLEKGARINEQNSDGYTALHIAAECGQMEAFDFLVSRGADTEIRSFHGYTILHTAACCWDVDFVRQLLDTYAHLHVPSNDSITDGRASPTDQAFSGGNLATCELFLDRFPQEATSQYKSSAMPSLMFRALLAPRQDIADRVELAKRYGCDISLKNDKGRNVLLQLLASVTKFQGSIPEGLIRKLCDLGIDINEPTKDGDTALHLAASKNRADLCIELVEAGANPMALNALGQNAIDVAQVSQSDEVLPFLNSWLAKQKIRELVGSPRKSA